MSCWHTTTSAYLLLFSKIFIYVTALQDLSRTKIPLKLCSGCSHYPSLKPNSSQPPVSGFTTLLNLNGNSVAIGAKNSLTILSLDGKSRHIIEINSTKDAFIACKNRNSEFCTNIVNLVIQHKGLIVACGTNSDSSHCWKVNETKILSYFVPKGYYAKEHVEYLKTDSYLYTAYSNTNGKGKMYKVNIDYPSNFLYMGFNLETSPHFVSLYEFGNYVYYFFTELPEEILDTIDKVEPFSRVGRLCKYDTGGKDNYEGRITLFSKVRLLCEKPGSIYNYLEATSFVKENGRVYIYGIFRSTESGSESAICRFSLTAIDKVFDSDATEFYEIGINLQSKRDKDDPRFLTCDSSLNTKVIKKDYTALCVAKPLASEAVKADGNEPVFEVDVTETPHIISENLPTKNRSYHVIHVLDSNVMTDFAAPVKQPSQGHVLGKRKISKNPLQVNEVKEVEGFIFVAAESKVIIVPDAFCQIYNSCRDCVAARNPHCAWDNNRNQCTKFNLQRSNYAQDVEQGNYSQVCQKAKASCQLTMLEKFPIPNREVVLSCKIYGVPTTKVISWEKDGKTLRVDPEMVIDKVDERQLVIKSYDLSEAGVYTCRVSNDITSGNCSVTLPGSKPRLQYSISKGNSSLLSCNATGYPKPTIVIKVFANSGGLRYWYSTKSIKIIRGREYQCLANNIFGAVVGDTYKIHSTFIQFVIMKLDWKTDYAEIGSVKYSKLASQLESEVNKLYINVDIFKGISDIKFREGSCVASFYLNGLANSSFEETEFTHPINNAIKNKHLGELEVNDIGTPKVDTQSTSKPLTTTTRPSYSSSTSYTTPPGTPKSGNNKGARSPSPGVKVYVVILIVIFLLLLAVVAGVLGYYCHMKQWMSKCLPKCLATSNSQKDDGELSDLSRSAKERESQRKLLGDVDGKKQASQRKQKGNCNESTDSKRSSQMLKHASIEIVRENSDAIDDGTEHDQSNC